MIPNLSIVTGRAGQIPFAAAGNQSRLNRDVESASWKDVGNDEYDTATLVFRGRHYDDIDNFVLVIGPIPEDAVSSRFGIVGTPNVVYGPYHKTGGSYNGQTDRTTIQARQGVYLTDSLTTVANLATLRQALPFADTPGTPPLNAYEPWASWHDNLDALAEVIESEIIGTKNLGGLRLGLNRWGLLSRYSGVPGASYAGLWEQVISIGSKYPLLGTGAAGGIVPALGYVSASTSTADIINGWNRWRAPDIVALADAGPLDQWGWHDPVINDSFARIFDERGRALTRRRLETAKDTIVADLASTVRGVRLPTLFLDAQAATGVLADIALDMAEWEMEYGYASVTATRYFIARPRTGRDLAMVPGQLLTFTQAQLPDFYIAGASFQNTPRLFVESVLHNFSAGVYTQTIEAKLHQRFKYGLAE